MTADPAAEAPRALVAETLDPDGAMVRWLSPDLEALGWRVLRLPVEEAAHHLGPAGVQTLYRDACARFRPHVVFVHPPYDHLDDATCADLRAAGHRVVAFAFDDAIYGPMMARSPAGTAGWARAIDARYDRYATTDPAVAAHLADAGARCVRAIRWAASDAPFEDVAALPPDLAAAAERSAVLIGRAYPRRVDLVTALAGAGVATLVFGAGWDAPEVRARLAGLASIAARGPVRREVMTALYRAAGVVVTTGDWEDAPVPMVKYRLLEVAFSGGFQVAQRSADLHDYFPEAEVPGWDEATELAGVVERWLADPDGRRAAAASAHARAHAEHRWTTRWGALTEGLGPWPALGPAERCRSWEVAMAAMAHAAERDGRHRAALASFEAWDEAAPDCVGALAGRARTLYALGRASEAADAARRALALVERETTQAPPVSAPRGSRPLGLGHAGWLDPGPELRAIALAAGLDAGEREAAAALVGSLAPAAACEVASLLQPSDEAGQGPIWRALLERALRASPRDPGTLGRNAAAWRAWLAERSG